MSDGNEVSRSADLAGDLGCAGDFVPGSGSDHSPDTLPHPLTRSQMQAMLPRVSTLRAHGQRPNGAWWLQAIVAALVLFGMLGADVGGSRDAASRAPEARAEGNDAGVSQGVSLACETPDRGDSAIASPGYPTEDPNESTGSESEEEEDSSSHGVRCRQTQWHVPPRLAGRAFESDGHGEAGCARHAHGARAPPQVA